MRCSWILLSVAALMAWVLPADAGELAAPIQVLADNQPLDVGGIGYAAPYMSDYDGDGVRDLQKDYERLTKEYSACRQTVSDFGPKTVRHGFVWLFVRNPDE